MGEGGLPSHKMPRKAPPHLSSRRIFRREIHRTEIRRNACVGTAALACPVQSRRGCPSSEARSRLLSDSSKPKTLAAPVMPPVASIAQAYIRSNYGNRHFGLPGYSGLQPNQGLQEFH